MRPEGVVCNQFATSLASQFGNHEEERSSTAVASDQLKSFGPRQIYWFQLISCVYPEQYACMGRVWKLILCIDNRQGNIHILHGNRQGKSSKK